MENAIEENQPANMVRHLYTIKIEKNLNDYPKNDLKLFKVLQQILIISQQFWSCSPPWKILYYFVELESSIVELAQTIGCTKMPKKKYKNKMVFKTGHIHKNV